MTCILHGLAHYQNRSASMPALAASRQAPAPGGDTLSRKGSAAALQRGPGSRLATPALPAPTSPSVSAAAVAAAAASASPPRGGRRHRPAGDALPYACSEVSSVASGWRHESKLEPGASLLSKGLLTNDITYAHETTPGVCVMKQMTLPAVPPASGQEFRVREVTKQLRKTREEDARARAAFKAHREQLVNAGAASEVLPIHQQKTAGKPALCKPMDSPAALRELMHAEDSYFTSEYRANNWWKMVFPSQRKDLKEHVRPYDNYTLFRDTAVKQAGAMREPMHTY
mmetsp:Transcript_12496/g.44180  ORF Transcript_12496/g.44180 Transcript_12496/m.44180 type:complete len:285 (+) Transcript_12496:92-946(+)|eukprot:CAMPEP_0203870860 /NCGR_PEP_ID=MMETSP0359-20131031/18450_1 /ASSEMBLY_ACC=CAM_ASM_000338 /TAXON_ID=268821 /ORGANISM="Scrippsiella Hangoei, Strain SHTV-5" /LENGTH=284 /DNA_ID=CAMNT_0050789531 /DNA_START=62 /DNA_END=916 /DNA_ORIENTATION=-